MLLKYPLLITMLPLIINRSLLTQARGAGEKYKGDITYRTELAKAGGDIIMNKSYYESLLG